jgi:hypothetical protein
MKKIFHLTIMSILAILVLAPAAILAAEKTDTTSTPPETKMTLNYMCIAQDSVTLTAVLLVKRGDMTYAMKNAWVEYFATGATDQPIGKIQTDQEGIARLVISSKGLPADASGMLNYKAKFLANAVYPEAEATVAAKPAKLALLFSIEDSIKVLKISATQKDSKNQDIPVPGETVNIYIPRLFSLLKIGEVTLDENGQGSFEFPKEIVGDTLGNLVVLARIEEHDVFGFVQGKNTINWGVPKHYYKAEVPSRELWTPIAPVWMIITLIIMLLGVWAHYGYAVYELVMIKKIGKNQDTKNKS